MRMRRLSRCILSFIINVNLKRILPALLLSFVAIANAAAPSDSLYRIYSGNLMAYPYTDAEPPEQTPAPEGYRPFHLEHYGRHGSRWLIGGGLPPTAWRPE